MWSPFESPLESGCVTRTKSDIALFSPLGVVGNDMKYCKILDLCFVNNRLVKFKFKLEDINAVTILYSTTFSLMFVLVGCKANNKKRGCQRICSSNKQYIIEVESANSYAEGVTAATFTSSTHTCIGSGKVCATSIEIHSDKRCACACRIKVHVT